MKRPAFIVLLVLIAGRILGTFIAFPSWILVIGILYLILSQFYLHIQKKPGTPRPTGQILILAVLLLGLYQERHLEEGDETAKKNAALMASYPAVGISGIISADPEWRENRYILEISDLKIGSRDQRELIQLKALVYLYARAADEIRQRGPARGDRVSICSKALLPPTLRNPTLFHYRAYLEKKGIFLLFRLKNPHEIATMPPPQGRFLINRILFEIKGLRERCESIFDASLSHSDAVLIKGLVIGESHDLDPDDREIFLRTGLMHLFSVSGLHTGMVALLLFFIFRLARLRFRVVVILTLAGLWFFAALTGFRSPVVRSAIMVSCLLGSYFVPGMKRPMETFSTLSFAAFWTLVINPRSLFQPDFILSYLSVFFLILFNPFFTSILSFDLQKYPVKRRGILAFLNRYVLFPLQAAFSIQIALLPVQVFYYHQWTPSALIANPIGIPLAFLAMIGGILLAILGIFMPLLIPMLAAGTTGCLFILRWVVGFLSRIPFAAIPMSPMPWFVTGLYYILLLGGNWVLEKKEWNPQRGVHCLFALLGLAAVLIWTPLFPGKTYDLEVFFLDVGQGDAIYIESSDGANMLIDAGRDQPVDMGEAVIKPFLKNRGVDAIEVLVASHPDSDHIGGFVSILDDFFVNYAIEGVPHSHTEIYGKWEDTLKEWHVMRKKVSKGDMLTGFGDMEILFLNPPDPLPLEWKENDASLVFSLRNNQARFLFTGDAGMEVERTMLQSGFDLRADVLKVGHHGSNQGTTEAFLKAVAPQRAIISAGERNPHGHPHAEVLSRLEQNGIAVYRTDRQGAVCIRLKGRRMLIETEN